MVNIAVSAVIRRLLAGISIVFFAAACIYDPDARARGVVERACIGDREAFLALDYRAFDQSFDEPSEENPTAGGWRGVAREELCVAAAADLIRDWREANADGASKGHESILHWHEGQLRAQVGQVNAAAELFGKAKKPVEDVDDEAWNAYADATIAFMLKDRARMDAVYARMKAIPEPADWETRKAEHEAWRAEMAEKRIIFPPARWPTNIHVVEQLIACFDRSYQEAYGAPNAGCEGG